MVGADTDGRRVQMCGCWRLMMVMLPGSAVAVGESGACNIEATDIYLP